MNQISKENSIFVRTVYILHTLYKGGGCKLYPNHFHIKRKYVRNILPLYYLVLGAMLSPISKKKKTNKKR